MNILSKITRDLNQDKVSRIILEYLKNTKPELGLDKLPNVIKSVRSDVDLLDFDTEHTSDLVGIKCLETMFLNDALHIREGLDIHSYFIDDTILSSPLATEYDSVVDYINTSMDSIKVDKFCRRAHRDGIQLIPLNRYSGGIMDGLSVHNNLITSIGHLQPIFSSDGGYTNISISKNNIDTRSQHKITIAGVLSGEFQGNQDIYGDPITTSLYPLRLGGGKLNCHVLSFKGNLKYEDIDGITGTIHDKRRTERRGLNIYGLDYDEFTDLMNKTHIRDRFAKLVHVIKVLEDRGSIKTLTVR